MSRGVAIVIALCAWTVSLALAYVGARDFYDVARLTRAGQRSVGRVVQVTGSQRGEFGAIIHFPIRTGVAMLAIGPYKSQDHKVGQELTVIYDADRPDSRARVDQGLGNWLEPVLWVGLGAVIAMMGFGVLKPRKQPAPGREFSARRVVLPNAGQPRQRGR